MHRKGYGECADRALKLWVTLARSFSTFNRKTEDHIRSFGLTQAQFGALECLWHKGPLSLGELCRKQLVTGGNMTVVIDHLEAEGLVERVRSTQDRRTIHVHLTGKGTKLIGRIFPVHSRRVMQLASVLTGDEQNEVRRLLRKLGRGLEGSHG